MPFSSKAQMRKFFVLERQGKISKGTLKEYLDATPNKKALPERLEKKSFVVGFEKVANAPFTIPKLHLPVAPAKAVVSPVSKAIAPAASQIKSVPKPVPGIKQSKGHMDAAMDRWNKRMFSKTAEHLSDQAALEVTNMQDRIPGTELRSKAETAQAKGRATRTFNVKNEDREFGRQYRKSSDTARGGRIYGTTK